MKKEVKEERRNRRRRAEGDWKEECFKKKAKYEVDDKLEANWV
jgi:hypothetical protein